MVSAGIRNIAVAATSVAAIFLSDASVPLLGEITEVRPAKGEVSVISRAGSIRVIPVSEETFRIETLPKGSTERFSSDKTENSGATDYDITATAGGIDIRIPGGSVFIDRETSLISFYDNDDNLLLEQSQCVDNSDRIRSAAFTEIAPDENLHTSPSGLRIPYIASDYGYGILFEDSSPYTETAISDTIVYNTFSDTPLAFYFINGRDRDLASLTEAFTALRGRQPLPPFRTMGRLTHNMSEMIDTVIYPHIPDITGNSIQDLISAGLYGLGYVTQEHSNDYIQCGAFTPFFFTDNADIENPSVKASVRERHKWLPYNYTLAYENARFGYPPVRPLDFRGADPGNAKNEYLWGDEVLVAPALKQGETRRKVFFPEGTWIDWDNNALTYRGGSEAVVTVPPSGIPLFIRRGAFIPQYERDIRDTGQYDPQELTVIYFPSEEISSYTLYDDDRVSPNSIADDAFMLTHFSGQSSEEMTSVEISSNRRGYEGIPPSRDITLVAACQSRIPAEVGLSDGSDIQRYRSLKELKNGGWYYSGTERRLYIRFNWDYEPIAIHIHKR